jgi:hypothetical protein
MSEVLLTLAGEGDVDIAVLERVAGACSRVTGVRYSCQGKSALIRRLPGFNEAARRTPWMVVADLDCEPCAAGHARQLLPHPAPGMCFRLAVREVEAWILGDAPGVAGLLSINETRVPTDPDGLPDPKRAFVDLARRSRSRTVQHDLVPRSRSGREVGPAYVSRLIDFIGGSWDPQRAREASRSLDRAMRRLVDLSEGA